MKKMLLISTVLAVFCLLLVVPSINAAEFTFDKTNFYEGGKSTLDYNKRVYKDRFPQSTTRYVYSEVNFKNLLYGVRNHSHIVKFRYLKPDGSLFWEHKVNMTAKSSWSTFYQSSGCGWQTPGKWSVGTYTVEVWVDGEFLTKAYFSIYDDVVHLRFKGVKFFESGYDALPVDQHQYRTHFSKSSTRYVNFMVESENLLYGIRDHTPLIIGKYYMPDGTFFGETRINNKNTPSTWKNPGFWRGKGWRTPGNWTPGTWRLEVYFGDKYVGQGSFTIY